MKTIINQQIIKVLQSQAKSCGSLLDEFGESFWIDLVLLLENGSYIQVNEYDCEVYEDEPTRLIPAELVQDEYSLKDIEGQRIIALKDDEAEFAVSLENWLVFNCLGGPGGNYPWVYKAES